jgi:hypothetical protein
MKHIGKTNITDVDASTGEKAARLVRLNAAADEQSRRISHEATYSLAGPQHRRIAAKSPSIPLYKGGIFPRSFKVPVVP